MAIIQVHVQRNSHLMEVAPASDRLSLRLGSVRSRFQFVFRRSLPDEVKILAARGEDGSIAKRPSHRLEGHAVSPMMNFDMSVGEGQDPASTMARGRQLGPSLVKPTDIVT